MRSIYANNSISGLGSYEVEPDMNYFGEAGSLSIALEGMQNDQAIFESVIAGDFAEITASINEGAEIEVVTEASLGDFVDKIKEYANKAWKKIKGLIMSFITKLKTVFTRDNKELVKKYRKQIDNNFSKYKDFKFKFAERTSASFAEESVDKAWAKIGEIFGKINNLNEISQIDDLTEKINNGDYKDEAFANVVSGSDKKSFKKDYHEKLFNEKDSVEGLTKNIYDHIISTLEGSKKQLSDLNKLSTDIDKVFKSTLTQIDKEKKAYNSVDMLNADGYEGGTLKIKDSNDNVHASTSTPKKGSPAQKQKAYARLTLLHKAVSVEQEVMNTIVSCNIAEAKFDIAQCRRVFVQAASWTKTSVKEETDLLQLIGEASDFEVETSFEDYEY